MTLYTRYMVMLSVLALTFGAATTSALGASPTAATAQAIAGQYLIHFAPGTTARQRAAAVRAQSGKITGELADLNTYAVTLPHSKHNSSILVTQENGQLKQLKSEPAVVSVEPNLIYHALSDPSVPTLAPFYHAAFTPNDPDINQQWAWKTIGAFAAWDTTQGDPGTAIAVVDTGVQLSHPEFAGKIKPGHNFVDNNDNADDQNGHGTHVSGTAAALTNNKVGGAGMCPKCSLIPVRVLDGEGSGSLANVANGITWAADHGAKVISLSLGGEGSSTLKRAVDYAWGKGVFLSCAAGNSQTDNPDDPPGSYPAAYPHCYGVAATDSDDAMAEYSNYGSWVKVAAPGSDIYSTWTDSGYNTIDGTSMATPHVSGLAGLLASQGLTNDQIATRICNSADKITGTGTDWSCGRIDAGKAVAKVKPSAATP